MKKTLLLLIMAVALMACKKTTEEPQVPPPAEPATLNVSVSRLIFDQQAVANYFNIESNTKWTISAPAWCVVSSTSGEKNAKITISPTTNNENSVRTAEIVVTVAGLDPKSITVEQIGVGPAILLDAPAYFIGPDPRTFKIGIKTNTTVKASISPSSWLTLEEPTVKAQMADKAYTISVLSYENSLYEPRYAEVKLVATDDPTVVGVIKIAQLPEIIRLLDYELRPVQSYLNIESTPMIAHFRTVAALFTRDDATEISVPKDATWVSYATQDKVPGIGESLDGPKDPKKSVLENTFKTVYGQIGISTVAGFAVFMFDENTSTADRTVKIKIKRKTGLVQTFDFIQYGRPTDPDAKFIKISPSQVNAYPKRGGVFALRILTNVEKVDFTTSHPQGAIDDQVREIIYKNGYRLKIMQYAPMSFVDPTEAIFTKWNFMEKGSTTSLAELTVKHIERPTNVTISNQRIDVSANPGEFNVRIYSEKPIKVVVKDSWIKEKAKSKASYDDTFYFTYDRNTSPDDRYGKIDVVTGNVTQTIIVAQQGNI